MGKTKILFISSEIDPYLPARRMTVLGRLLPQKMHELGHDVRIFAPRFGAINERRHQLHDVIRLSGQNITINENEHQLMLKVASLMPQRTQIYFIDNEEYFSSRKIYRNEKGDEYEDQAERCLFYAKGVAETVKKLRWIPDIIYCQGWFAFVAPMIFKKTTGEFNCFRKAKVVLALFDNAFNSPMPATTTSTTLKVSGITKAEIAEIKEKPVSYEMFCKFAIKFCDGIIATEPNIPQEVLDYAKENEKKILDLSSETELKPETYSQFFDSFYTNDINNPL